MSGADFPSWRITNQERRNGAFALIQAASSLLGPLGPGIAWGLEYLYNRRSLIFDQAGGPIQAYSYQGQALRLSALAQGPVSQRGTLSLNVDLSKSARDLGLRAGDPVTIVLTGQAYLQTRSGLVVPARIGEPVNLAVPQGNYTLAAFGGTHKSLFTQPDPVTALGGESLLLSGRRQLEVPLAARESFPVRRTPAGPQQGQKFWTPQNLQRQNLPRSLPAGPKYYCEHCSAGFPTEQARERHTDFAHVKLCSYCGRSGSGVGWHEYDCPIGKVASGWDRFKRFLEDL